MQLVEFPQSSKATHVLNKVPVPLHPFNPLVLSKCNKSMSGVAVQLSLLTGIPNASGSRDSPQLTSIELEHVTVGAVVSMILMFCVQVAEFPQSSITTHVRLMVPVLLQPTIPVSSSDIVTTKLAGGVQLSYATISPVTDTKSEDSHDIVM